MNRKNTISVYLTLTVLRGVGIAFTFGTYVKYLNLRGLNVFETNMVNMIFYASLMLFDIPTGAFADVYGRKKSVVISCLCFSASGVVYGMSHTLLGFAAAEALGALGWTFSNGALTAWLVDRMRHHNIAFNKTSTFARMNIASNLSGIPAAALGSYLMTVHISLAWYAEASVMACAGIFAAIGMHEEYFKRKKVSFKKSYKMMLASIRMSFRYLRQNAVVRFIVFSSMIQIFAVQAPNMQWVPRFESVIGGTAYLGTAFAVFSVAMTFGAYIAGRLVKSGVNEAKLIRFTQALIGMLLILSVFLPAPWNFVVFILHQVPRGMYGPVKTAYLHDHIPSRVRATLASFESVFPNLGGMVGLLTTGAAGQYVGIPFAWMVSGVSLVVVALFVIKRPPQVVVKVIQA